jgi:hypothetical protein
LKNYDDLEDDELFLFVAMARMACDSGRRIPLDEVMARLGITPEELEDA